MKFTLALAVSIVNFASAIELETKTEAKQSGSTPISMENLGVPSTQDTSSDAPGDAQNSSAPTAASET